VKREIDEELRFHLDRRAAENLAAGMAPVEAAREARKRFGNLQAMREICREARGAHFGEAMSRDLHLGLRMLAKSPGFTAVAVLMLAVAIGSVTAMFSVVRVCVLNPFSSPNAARMVQVWSSAEQTVSTLDYFDIREQSSSFAELGAYSMQRVNFGGEHPESLYSVACTPGVLRAFGVPPALGRWLEPADEQKSAAPVAIISDRLWRESFAADPGLIGRPIRLNGDTVTVVGVMPASFHFCSPWMPDNMVCDIWRPLQLQRDGVGRDFGWWLVMGCLKEGVSLASADAEIKALGARLKSAYPVTNLKKPFLVRSLRFELTHYGSSYVWMIFDAALLMLLVACLNVASMLLARNARRQGEFGIRVALGATPGRIFRLVLSQSLVLALAGTLGGLGLGAAGLRFLIYLAQAPDASQVPMVVDGAALLFAAALTLITALLAGVPPASAALRVSVADLLRSDSRGAAGSGSRNRLMGGLIVTQVAVAFILANLAVLLSASYVRQLAAVSNVATDYVLTAELNLTNARYEKNEAMGRFFQRLTERACALPGVAAAGVTSQLPLEGGASRSILVNDEVFDPAANRTVTGCSEITPGYFAAAGVPLLKGRTLQSWDGADQDNEAVINRALAEKCWPHQDPLGKIIRVNDSSPWFRVQVVGVVDNMHWRPVEAEPSPQMYWTTSRAWGKTHFLIVRSSQPASVLAPVLRGAVAELDPDLPLSRVRTFRTIVRDATSTSRLVAGLINFCMLVAIALVAVGLYGTLSYHVLYRTREIGVRMALGAARYNVVGLVFRQGFGWVLLGIVIGVGGALALASSLRSMVYDLNTVNPLALGASAGAVVLAAALACWFPARRASKVEPMEALRCD
jgi:predicted permease